MDEAGSREPLCRGEETMTKMEDIRRGQLADAERMTTAPADDNARRTTLPSNARLVHLLPGDAFPRSAGTYAAYNRRDCFRATASTEMNHFVRSMQTRAPAQFGILRLAQLPPANLPRQVLDIAALCGTRDRAVRLPTNRRFGARLQKVCCRTCQPAAESALSRD